uniref:Reverse transcriptase domain-containing protein n=1 Tax=Tanacetum cinerariifolium TaxID=118510 RepID=A0A6L2N1T2_TANCI|nr:hypothetical protein [Tanacetum cinerariifolium]
MVLEKDLAGFTLQEMESHPLMFLIRTFSMILQTFSPTFHNPSTSHTRASYVGTILTMVMIVHHGSHLSMSRNQVTIKTLYSIDHQPQSIQVNLNQQKMNELLNMMQSFCEKLIQQKQAANIDQSSPQEMSIQDLEDLKQHYLDEMKSLINEIQIKDYRNDTIPEKESDEFIKSSVEDLVLTHGKFVTFSNPFFDLNDDFTSSDDESLSDEDVPEDNVNIYSNPLFEFDDEYISSDVNPLFDEVLEDIERKVSYDSNLDEPTLLVTPFFDANEDEYLDPVDEIEFLLHHDSSTPKMSIVFILKGFTNEPPLKENDDLFDLKSKTDNWKKILHDALIDDLMTDDKFFEPRGDIDEIDAFLDINISTDIKEGYYDSKGDVLYLERLLTDDTTPNPPPEVFLDHNLRSLSDINDLKIMVKIFDPGIHEKFFSPTYSPFLLSPGSEDTIFDSGIYAFHFSHQSGTFMCFNVYSNMLNESLMEICSSTHFNPNITMI